VKLGKLIAKLQRLRAECGGEAEVFVYCKNGQFKQPQASIQQWNEFAAVFGKDEVPFGADMPEDIFVELS